MPLRYMTGGESHGPCLTAILEGVPAGLELPEEHINRELARRQIGYGRGARMQIEKDRVELRSGLRFGLTLGSPLTLVIANRDWENWKTEMSLTGPRPKRLQTVTSPRPGHADLAGALKFNQRDVRNVLERASARETAARVAVAAVCKALLRHFKIEVFSHVVQIGTVRASASHSSLRQIQQRAEKSAVRCADPKATRAMKRLIDKAKQEGDSIGGIFEVIATGVPAGLGNVMTWTERLDGRLAQALLSIPGVKGVEIGLGFESAQRTGSQVHDPIQFSSSRRAMPQGHGPSGGFYHTSNNAGGIEGGMTTGEPVVLRAVHKPIPTLKKPLPSVDLATKQSLLASKERSDVCATPAAGVVGEAAVAFVLAQAFLEKFGSDTIGDITTNFNAYIKRLAEL